MKDGITTDGMWEDDPVVWEDVKAFIANWVSFVLWEIVKGRILADELYGRGDGRRGWNDRFWGMLWRVLGIRGRVPELRPWYFKVGTVILSENQYSFFRNTSVALSTSTHQKKKIFGVGFFL